MPKQLFKVVLYVIILSVPTLLLAAPPTFPTSLPDVTPIDQQTLMLASGGAVYAYYKIRESRRRKK